MEVLLLMLSYFFPFIVRWHLHQHSLPRSNITNQDKEGAPTSFPSLNTLAPLWPRQDDPVYRLNQNELGASTPIHSDTNVSRLAPITQRHDVVPPENLVRGSICLYFSICCYCCCCCLVLIKY